MAQGDKPVKEFRAGGVRASIWRDEVPGQGDEPLEVFSVRVEKRFKDAQGVWQSTNRFKRRELAEIFLRCDKCKTRYALPAGFETELAKRLRGLPDQSSNLPPDVCPECGNAMVPEGRCFVCRCCGYSKCG